MKEQLIQMLKRSPRPDAIATVQQVREFKKFHAKATKLLAKKLNETEVASPDDIYELARAGSEIEDLVAAPAQKELGE